LKPPKFAYSKNPGCSHGFDSYLNMETSAPIVVAPESTKHLRFLWGRRIPGEFSRGFHYSSIGISLCLEEKAQDKYESMYLYNIFIKSNHM